DQAKVFSCQLQQQGITFKNLPGALNWHFAGTWDYIFSKHPMYQQKNLEKYIWPQSSCLLRRAIALPIYLNMSKGAISVLIDKLHDSLCAIIA
ncbi:MAG: DegT/DnrJ/EryC1/StrS aminotransferase, partial [uncultured bacterium]